MKKNIIYTIAGVILIGLIGVGICFFTKDQKEEPTILSDSEKFQKEYATSNVGDNVFVYRSIEEIIKIMENGTGIVYLGFPECPWCQAYVKYLNEVAKEEGVKEIYYFNILKDRQENTKEYQKIVKLLGDSIEFDEEGNHRVFVPNVSFHIKGELIGNNYETAVEEHIKGIDSPAEYWTEKEVKDLKETLTKYTKRVVTALNTCTDCNK